MKQILLLLLFPVFLQSQSLDWQIEDVTFQQGDTVRAEFRAFGFDSLTAYQMCMLFDTGALKFVAVTFPPGNPMQLSLGGFSWFGKPGYGAVKPREVRHLRSMPYSKTFADNTHGFSVVFVAKQSGVLSQKFTLSLSGLYPPLPPISYRWPLISQPLTVAYVLPAETTATDAPTLEESVRIYPNPTNGWLWIESPSPVQVRIFDYSGRMTHQDTVTASGFSNLTAGVNVVWVTDGKDTFLKTVIKQ